MASTLKQISKSNSPKKDVYKEIKDFSKSTKIVLNNKVADFLGKKEAKRRETR
jgi:hypothetical protein